VFKKAFKNFEMNKAQGFGRRLGIMATVIAGVLAIPFIAMQFTKAVNWTAFDFGVAALLLISTAAGIEMVIRFIGHRQTRYLLYVCILLTLLLVWAELAVGIF
jgi:hypothetical protein